MSFNVYDENNNLRLQDQQNSFTINNLEPLHTYSNWKIVTSEGKTMILKPFSTTTQPATSVDVQYKVVNLDTNSNQTTQITPTVLPADTTDSVNYTSPDSEVATVSPSGLVTAVGKGSCDITVLAGSANTYVHIIVNGG